MDDNQSLDLTLEEVRLTGDCTDDEIRLAKNVVNGDPYKSFCVGKDNDNKYYILISAKDGSNIIVPCATSRQAIVFLRRFQLNYLQAIISGAERTLTTSSVEKVTTNIKSSSYFEIKPDTTLPEKGKKVLDGIRERLSLPPMEEKEYMQYYTDSDAEKCILDFSIGSIFSHVDSGYEKSLDSIKFDELKKNRKFKKFTDAYDSLSSTDIKEICDMFEQVAEFKRQEKEGGKEFYLSRMAQLRCGNKLLSNALISIRYILEKVNIAHQGDMPRYDFESREIPNTIQDYLLEYLFRGIEFTPEQIQAIKDFKTGEFYNVNYLLRGSLRRNDRFDSELLRNIIDRIIALDEAFKNVPNRNFELVIRRIGLGINKGITKGTENMYDSFVSFGSNQGTVLGDVSGKTEMHYKRVLKADDKVLPIDALLPTQLKSTQSECELLLPPFNYTVMNEVVVNPLRNDIYIEMGEISPIDTIELLKQRILEIRKRENERRTRFEEYSEDEEKRKVKDLGYDEFEVRISQLDFFDLMEKIESSDEFQKLYQTDREITADQMLKEGQSPYGKDHVRRMAFFIRLLSNLEGISEHDKELLMKAAEYAYIGIKDDEYNSSVGRQSLKRVRNFDLLRGYSKEDKRVLEFLIEQNTLSERENQEAIEELPKELQSRYTVLLKFLQESERLDGMRFSEEGSGLAPYKLVCVSSQKIIYVAYQTYLYYINYMEDERQKRIDDTIDYAVNKLGIQIDYEEELEEAKRQEEAEDKKIKQAEEDRREAAEIEKEQHEILEEVEIVLEDEEGAEEASDEEIILEDEPLFENIENRPIDEVDLDGGEELLQVEPVEEIPQEEPEEQLEDLPEEQAAEPQEEEKTPIEKTPEEVLSEIVATSVRSLGLEKINSSAKNVLEEFEQQTFGTAEKVKKKTRDNKEGR